MTTILENSKPGTTGLPSSVIPTLPLTKAQIAKGYQKAYFLMRDLNLEHGTLASELTDGYTLRVIAYLAYRFNFVCMSKTVFSPKPWISLMRFCDECGPNGCDACKSKGFIGGRIDTERSI